MKASTKEMIEKARKDKVKFINLQFSDLFGTLKSVTIPIEKLDEALEKGIWFDGSSIEGFTRIYESDMYLRPDPDTYCVLPWLSEKEGVARFICDVYTPEGKPFEGDPRNILKKVVAEAEAMGFKYMVGPEYEFYLFKTDADGNPLLSPHDKAGYFDASPLDMAMDVRRDIVLNLEKLGMKVEISHHEVGPGQHEIDFMYGEALNTADRGMSLKYVVRSIAPTHKLYASFMPKPILNMAGSGMHVHQSLFDIKTGKNLFYDAKDENKLSQIAKHFIAGQLKHIKAVSAITGPTVNSYKRLVSGYEAPVYICWGQINRSALIRIPRYSEGREQATRAELRCPDPSCNPYLAFAVMLKAGLEGIKNKTPLPAPVNENVYNFDDTKLRMLRIDSLPKSLYDSLIELEKDPVILGVLGKKSAEDYLRLKKKEWDEFRMQVTPWETDMYLQV